MPGILNTVKVVRYYLLIPLTLIFIFSCKKEKKDETPPVITMHLPLSGAHYNMFDTIRIAAHFSDETKLTTAEITLRDMNGNPVQSSITATLSGTTYDLTTEMELYEFRLPSGTYNLEVVVNDGENVGIKTTAISITESPLLKKGYYFVTKNGSQHIYTKADTNYVSTASINLNGTFVGSSISTYYQNLYVASSANQSFKTIDISTGITKWTLANASTGATLTACTTDGKNVFLGKDDGNIYKYNKDGTIVRSYNSDEMTYYVKSIFYCGDYVVAGLADFTSTTKKTVVFESSTGIVKKVILNTNLKSAFVKSAGELYLVSNNQQGKAVVEVLTVSGGGLNEVLDLGTYTVYSACMINSNTLLVATSDNNVYYYQYNTNTFLTVLTGMPAFKMSYSPVFNKLYLSSYKDFHTYTVSSFALSQQTNYTHNDTIQDFQVIFNK
ncbi:MAG: hypothetical protein Q8M29_08815 [Bacteroidota bacterium]|nr:hypothetical protein [Bacteroidota bacterium]